MTNGKMLNLNDNWLTEEPIDFEYKTYLILGYEQNINESFKNNELYPKFTDLLNKLLYTKTFLNGKNNLNNSKKLVKGIGDGKIVYESAITDYNIEQIQEIAEFALPIFNKLYIKGETIFDNVYKSIKVFSLTLHHSSPLEGIMIVDINKKINVYKYSIIRDFLNEKDSWGISFEFLFADGNSAKRISEISQEYKFNVFLAKYELDYNEEYHKDTVLLILKKKLTNRIVNNL